MSIPFQVSAGPIGDQSMKKQGPPPCGMKYVGKALLLMGAPSFHLRAPQDSGDQDRGGGERIQPESGMQSVGPAQRGVERCPDQYPGDQRVGGPALVGAKAVLHQ